MKQSANQLNISETELLEYITQNTQATERRPDGFGITLNEYVAKTNIPKTTARNRLKEMIEAGKLQKKQMVWQGHEQTVYYK